MESPNERDEPFAQALGALASGTRLAIMRALRTPRTVTEVEVGIEEGGKLRPLARQTVRQHVEKLLEAGVVTAREGTRDFGTTMEYFVNHQTIFSLAESLRSLARQRPSVELDQPTVSSADGARPVRTRPCLVLVKGVEEGTAYDLRPHGRTEWLVGRRRGLEVALDFDPSVSAEHACIRWDGQAHAVEDRSRNGTSVNFRRLPREGPTRLEQGDILGVGKTLLVYWR